MSVGLQLSAEIPRRGVTRRKMTPEALFGDIMLAIWEASKAVDPVLEGFLSEARSERTLDVQLVPGPEPVSFEVHESQVVVSANTTAAGGPGYHAHVVSMLDAVASGLGLQWNSDGEARLDETGYFEDRHFESIEREMLAWFRSVAKIVLDRESEGLVALRLCLPTDFQPVGDWFVATPMGPMTRTDLLQVRDGDEPAAVAVAARFFPWWDRGVTAHSLRGLALAQCWTKLRWVPPKNEDERRAAVGVLELFDRAQALDADISLPEAELGELRAILRDGAEWVTPRAEGIGYRRGWMRHDLTGRWSIEAPGYLTIEWDDGTWVGTSETRTIYATTFSWTGADDDDGSDFVARFDDEPQGRRLGQMSQALQARLWPLATGDAESAVKTRIRAAIGTGGTGCMLSIDSRIEADDAFAETVARSAFVAPGA